MTQSDRDLLYADLQKIINGMNEAYQHIAAFIKDGDENEVLRTVPIITESRDKIKSIAYFIKNYHDDQ